MSADFVSKGWGYEKIIANSPLYCGKVLHVVRGRKCSWHYHRKKDETFYVASGELLVRWMGGPDVDALIAQGWEEAELLNCGWAHRTLVLRQGDSFHVPPGMRHQFSGNTDVTLVEFSTEHSDDDVVRVVKGD